MSWTSCPICSTRNSPGVMRCTSCGADFSDPDIQAMAEASGTGLPDPDVPAGSLASGKFLFVSRDGLASGTTLRTLAIIGAALLLIAFLIPVAPGFGDSTPAWKALEGRAPIPLLYPILAIALGIIAIVGPLERWQKSAALVLGGLIGLGTLPFLGDLAGAPEKLMPAMILGLAVGSWGLLLRSYDAQNMLARKLALGGAALVLIAYFIPMSDAHNAVPVELRLFGLGTIDSAGPFSVFKKAMNKDPMVFFSTLYLLLPLVAMPVAAALSWKKPDGAWDSSGNLIKPLGWLMVLYAPLGFALFAFNLLGYNGRALILDNAYIPWDDFTSAAFLGRVRLMLMATAYSLWAVFPIVAIHDHFFGTSGSSADESDAAPADESGAAES